MELNVWISLGAGFLSFISPCTLPLYPSYLSYITGISVGQMTSETGKKKCEAECCPIRFSSSSDFRLSSIPWVLRLALSLNFSSIKGG